MSTSGEYQSDYICPTDLIINYPREKRAKIKEESSGDIVSHHVEEVETFPENSDKVLNVLFKSIGLERVPYTLNLMENGLDIQVTSTNQEPGMSIFVQNTLVEIFFSHDHCRCPVIDENEFMLWFRSKHRPHSPSNELLLKAIIFTAFSHANEDILSISPFTDLRNGHKSLFVDTKTAYHELATKSPGDLALVQTALLLSFWSPYDMSREVNSFWTHEAFRHALMGRISDGSSSHRQRIVWWCCLIRNRVIALGLRRPASLESYTSGRLPTRADFGLEAIRPWFSSAKAKKAMIKSFIDLCQLTEIMFDAILLRKKLEPSDYTLDHGSANQVDEAGQIDQRLTKWRNSFDASCGKLDSSTAEPGELVFWHMLHMMHLTTVSALYEQYLVCEASSSSQLWMMRSLAIHKVKETCAEIAMLCGSLLKVAKAEEFPLMLGAWIILPISILLIQINTQRGYEDETKLRQLEYLMRVLYCLSQRFSGASFVAKLIDAIIARFSAHANTKQDEITGISLFPGQQSRVQAREDELILYVFDIIRQGLAEEII